MYNEISSNKRKSAFLLIIFFLLVITIGWWASLYYETGPAPIVIAAIIAILIAWMGYFKGDSLALAASGAKQIRREDNPYVYRMVENLSITTGLPMPKTYIIDDPALNAFATGRDPEHASIALTTGIINALENEELEGVLAHELSHIKNYDIRYMMLVLVCVGIIALISDFTLRSMFWGGRRRGSNKGNGGAVLLIVGLVLAILAPLFSKLIQLAISRKREYLADASGSLITRYPAGLANALEKIAHGPKLQRANKATAHLYIANPLKSDILKKKAHNLFSTHPPIEERIKRLRNMV